MDWILKKEDSTERDREKFGSSNNFFFILFHRSLLYPIPGKKTCHCPRRRYLVWKILITTIHSWWTEKNIASILLFTRSAQGGKLEKYTRIYNKILKYNSVCLRILHVGMTNAINNTIYGVYHHIIIWFTDVFSIKKI